MEKLVLTIPNRPVGKGRPRFSKFGVYVDAQTKAYEKKVQIFFKQSGYQKLDGAVGVEIIAYFPIPKTMPKKNKALALEKLIVPEVKPDADNIAKIILDGLNGLWFQDDKSVCELTVHKYYSSDPRCEVSVWAL